MRRRVLLGALCGAVPLAGCSSDGGPEPTVTPTTNPSPTPHPTATPTLDPGTAPADRTVAGEAVASNGLAVTADRWFGLERVRYRDPQSGELDHVGARRDRFVAYDFTLANAGEEAMDAVRDGRFRLRVDGTAYEHIHRFPGGVRFDSLAQPDDQPTIQPLRWYDRLAPGASVSLQLVFDAAKAPGHRHYLAWDPRAAVDGSSDPVYLHPA